MGRKGRRAIQTSKDYIYRFDSDATKIDCRKLNRDDEARVLARFHVYDALSQPVQQGRPISDTLIVSYDRILTYSTETNKAENSRMLTQSSMINGRYNPCASRQFAARPFVPSASNVSFSSSPRTGRPVSLDESCLNGP
jgi:hypothetical protein